METQNAIELRNVSMTYPGGVQVIQDTSLIIPEKDEGEFIAILGPSGCGKSTVLKFISGLVKPTTGQVMVKGVEVGKGSPVVGQVFQEYSSFPWLTVLENVMFGLEIKGIKHKDAVEQAMILIKRVGLEGQEHKYARTPSLSGGQLQRVAIARSLLSNPQVLLLDEPFGALDIKTRLQMQELLGDLYLEFKPTFIMVTHDIQEAVYLSDVIYVMKKPPSSFVKQIHIDLGLERDKSIKRSSKFLEYVNTIEDIMMQMEG